MSLLPTTKHNIKLAIARAAKADTRDNLGHRVRDAGSMIKRELRDSNQRVAIATQKAVKEHAELLALLSELNEATKAQIDKLPPKEPEQ